MKDKNDKDKNGNDIESLDIILNEVDIENIVDKGVRKKIPFIKYLIETVKRLGLKNIFHDRVELAVIVLSSVLFIAMSYMLFSNYDKYYMYKFLFVMSPVIYLSTVCFTFVSSKVTGAFKLEMTCKYDFCQLSALRIFIFSILTMIINTVSIVVLWFNGRNISVLRAVIIAATGLFFFSAVFIYLLLKVKWKLAISFIVVWIISNIFIAAIDNKLYIDFLLKVPLYVHVIISAVCIVLYVRNLNVLVNFRHEKGEI